MYFCFDFLKYIMTDEFSVDKLPSRYFTQATRYYCYAPLLSLPLCRRRYSSSPPTTAPTTGNSTTVTASVSVSEASRDEYDDQPVKSSSKLDDDGTCTFIGQ